MILELLKLANFRNISGWEWSPHDRANLILGDNAQGKTNLLEAVFLLATTRPLRQGAESDDLIKEGSEEARAYGRVKREEPGIHRDIEVRLKREEARQIFINGKRAQPLSKAFGQLTAVLFVPEDLQLVKAGPQARRYYLDLELSQASPLYLQALQTYQRALKQRNAGLRKLREGKGSLEAVQAFDQPLIKSGVEVIAFRQEALAEISPLAADAQARIAGGDEKLGLRYLSSVGQGDLEAAFAKTLAARREEEAARGTTLSGPHRDDIEILLQGKAARLFASQGQQRSIALALKLAEVQFLSRKLQEPPLLLLDDVLSELDLKRQKQLLELLDEKVQTFVTSTHAQDLAYKAGQVVRVAAGRFT